jgi:hypothetical protein
MSDLYDELMDYEILGGLEFSQTEKEQMISQAYERGLDLDDFETWEEIRQALDGFDNEG